MEGKKDSHIGPEFTLPHYKNKAEKRKFLLIIDKIKKNISQYQHISFRLKLNF